MSRVEDLFQELRDEIQAAYERGFEAGAADMRDRILNAAQGPVSPAPVGMRPAATPPKAWVVYAKSNPRAPRGAVGAMLKRILTERPGLTVTQIEAVAGDYDSDVAAKSIGNELRRFDGMKYKRDPRGGWHLFESDMDAPTETAGESPAVVATQEEGGQT